MEEDRQRPREGFSAWMGVLDAFREAVEETVQEMVDRTDMGPEKAREAVRETMRRAQTAFEDARERVDFVPRREFDALSAEVDALRLRLEAHESHESHARSRPASGAGAGDTAGPDESSGGGSDIPVDRG